MSEKKFRKLTNLKSVMAGKIIEQYLHPRGDGTFRWEEGWSDARLAHEFGVSADSIVKLRMVLKGPLTLAEINKREAAKKAAATRAAKPVQSELPIGGDNPALGRLNAVEQACKSLHGRQDALHKDLMAHIGDLDQRQEKFSVALSGLEGVVTSRRSQNEDRLRELGSVLNDHASKLDSLVSDVTLLQAELRALIAELGGK